LKGLLWQLDIGLGKLYIMATISIARLLVLRAFVVWICEQGYEWWWWMANECVVDTWS